MVQELIDLRQSIVEGRYQDALDIVDELEGMGKQAILRNLESFLVRLLIHLIKNSVQDLLSVVRKYFINLPGGKEWLERRV
jgi:hypothetical protein